MQMKKYLIGIIMLVLILSVSLPVLILTINHYGSAEGADGATYPYSSQFVASKNSDKYHYPGCPRANQILKENRICFDTPEEAIAAGYHPCKVCNPPTSSSQMKQQTVSTNLDKSKFGESGIAHVIDGDTIDVAGVGRVRLADIDCPEPNAEGGIKAKDFTKKYCEGKKVYLDIDDINVTDRYDRFVAVVYAPYNDGYVNLNQLLLKKGYAKADDYPNEFNPNGWVKNPLEVVKIN